MKKKVKRYQDGGLAGIAKTAQDLMGKLDSGVNEMKYGSGGSGGGMGGLAGQIQPVNQGGSGNEVGFLSQPMYEQSKFVNLSPAPGVMPRAGLFKKGGHVKSSASKRADGIAIRGKTRA